MHQLKEQCILMQDAIARKDLTMIGDLLESGYRLKKQMASGIANEQLERIHAAAIKAGARSGKISGAGGGGFMVFYVEPSFRSAVRNALHTFGGREYPLAFVNEGVRTWKE
jgi:D-glycero-alpha-D-manno-heptose-7-phosphate kinase